MKLTKYYSLIASSLLLAGLTQSCATEDPFGGDGEGELRMKMVINSDVTRADADEDALRENCVVYLSGTQGLLYKYKGLENVPESLMLKSGQYVAEAWTGDSVSASWDKKFYRGYEPFTVQTGVNSVVIQCKIQNVVVSINPATVDLSLMKDWKINVANSRASLDFTEENMDYAKGYFMMPNADTCLTYTITGTNAEGREFSHTGTIENPKRAHEYVLNLQYNPEYEKTGGAFVTIVIDDSEVEVKDEVSLFSRPAVKGIEFDITKQIVGNAGKFTDKVVKVNAFGGIKQLHLISNDYSALNLPAANVDLINMVEAVGNELKEAGLKWDYSYNDSKNMAISYVTLGGKWLNALAQRDTEYVMTLSVTDAYGKTTEQPIRIAVGEGAIVIDDPVTIEDIDSSDLMAVLSSRATLTGAIVDAEAENPGIRYRESGTTAWTFVPADTRAVKRQAARHLTPAQATRAAGTKFTVTVSGLKPGTRYEYQAVAGEFYSESKYFTTESTFTIPNGGFETWGTYSASTLLGTKTVTLPGANRDSSFWESGNEGAATANMTLTSANTSIFHSGQRSAELKSKSAMGMIAAGNIFAGVYVKTDGTDGVLKLGRDFDGSHPDKVRVYANYRPGGSVSVKSGNSGYLNGEITSGGTDAGQIYVALSTAKVDIRTKASERKLFNADDPEILAYGQVTWKEAFGPDGGLQAIEIPFTYNSRAKSNKPLYLIIVASASKYGDYFCGSSSSVMYLDDFELVYE